MIILHTSYGDITLTLDFDNTPVTANNFLEYAQSGFYDGKIFHRVISNFMIQGGGFNADMEQAETRAPIKNEAKQGGSNVKGSIAMARTSDPHSASAQFFINVVDNPFLDFKAETMEGFGYCVFGHVTAGMDVVEKIKAVETGSRAGHTDVPVEPVIIERVTVEETVNS